MLKTILSYGVLAGVIAGGLLSAVVVSSSAHQPSAWSMAIGYLIMLVALSAVFIAIKRRRDIDRRGVIRFWPAFGLGIGISLVAAFCYALAWELTLAITHMDFAGDYARFLIDEQKAKGVSSEELLRFTADMEKFKADYANPMFRLPMTFAEIFPVGVLVSLVSAALLRNSRFLPLRRTRAA